jgi:hypothetical protein
MQAESQRNLRKALHLQFHFLFQGIDRRRSTEKETGKSFSS